MAQQPTKAVIYTRISSDPEGEALGVERQEQDCRALADRLGWTLHPDRPVIIDNNIGASTRSRKRRPGFDELIEGVRSGRYDGLLFYSNSRLTRRPREYETIIDLVEETGVKLASVASGSTDLTTADGRQVARMLAAADAGEAERIGERVARAFRQRREEHGLPNPSRRGFGYAPGGLQIVDEEADVLRDTAEIIRTRRNPAVPRTAVRRLLADGEPVTLGEVVSAWERAGIRPVHGAAGWSRQTVRSALCKPRVAGLIESRGTVLGAGDPVRFPAILDHETWTAVCAAVADRSEKGPHVSANRRHVLAGKLTCGLCGQPMKINALRAEDGSLRSDSFVVCSRSQHGCGRVKRNLALLDAFIHGAVKAKLTTLGHLYSPEAEVEADAAAELRRLQAEHETVEVKMEKLRQSYERDDLDSEDFVVMSRRLRNRLREVEAELAQYREPSVAELGEDPLKDWEGDDLDLRREVLDAIVETVIVRPMGKIGPARVRAMMPSATDIVWR